MSNSPTLPQAVEIAVLTIMDGAHRALPATVNSYDSAKNTVAVQPISLREYTKEDGTKASELLPVVTDVPVVFPGSGDFKITFPVSVGDTVLLIIADHSIDLWNKNGGVKIDPKDPRRSSLSDAIAIPGLLSSADATDQTSSSAMVISGDEVRIGSKDASELVAIQSDIDDLKTIFNTWIPVSTDGGLLLKNLLTTTGGGWNPTGSTKVKVE